MGMKPMNAKLDIIKLRSVVERNILDNDRLQQKAEARKSSDGQQSRLDVDNKVEATKKSTESIDNSKHHSNDDSKLDNFQLVESGRNAANKRKRRRRKVRDLIVHLRRKRHYQQAVIVEV